MEFCRLHQGQKQETGRGGNGGSMGLLSMAWAYSNLHIKNVTISLSGVHVSSKCVTFDNSQNYPLNATHVHNAEVSNFFPSYSIHYVFSILKRVSNKVRNFHVVYTPFNVHSSGLSFVIQGDGKISRKVDKRNMFIARESGRGAVYCLKRFTARANVRTQWCTALLAAQ